MGRRIESARGAFSPSPSSPQERLGPCPWGPVSSLLIGDTQLWEIQSSDRPPAENQAPLLPVAFRLSRIDETSPRFARIRSAHPVKGQSRVRVDALSGRSLAQNLAPGAFSLQGWAVALREMLLALQELSYVGLSHGRIDTQSFRRQPDGRIVLDFFQPLAFAELPGESVHVLSLKSPERERSIRFPIGIPSDLFAVGRLSRFMLDQGVDPHVLARDPRATWVLSILDRLAAPDPQDRYAHPESALHDLESLLQEGATRASQLDPLRREPLPQSRHLIARQSESYRLTQAWSKTQAFHSAPTMVVGTSGSGRSDFLLHHHRALLLAGHFSLLMSPSAWGGSRRGFVGHLLASIDRRCEARGELEKLRAALADGLQDLVQESDALRERFPELHTEIPATSPQLATLLARLLHALAPIAIFVDDADRCESLARELFRDLIALSSHRGVLWVGSAQRVDGAWMSGSGLRGAQSTPAHLTLHEFSASTLDALVCQHLGTRSLPEGLGNWLVLDTKRSAQQTISALDEAFAQGVLYRSEGQWSLKNAAKYNQYKSGLQTMVMRGGPASQSHSPARAFLLRAAALGPAVRLDAYLDVLSPTGDGTRWLEHSTRIGAVVCYADGAHRLSHHDLVPKLLETLSPQQRRRLHNELFSALSRVQPCKQDGDTLELCAEQGYWAELNPGQRQRLLLDAIERSVLRNDQEALLRWYGRWTSRTPEPIESTKDYLVLADAALKLGAPLQAKNELEKALRGAVEDFERAALLARLADIALACHDMDRGDEHARHALHLLEQPRDNRGTNDLQVARLRAKLRLVRCAAHSYCAPWWTLGWSLFCAWKHDAPSLSAGALQQFNLSIRVFLMRFAPRRWAQSLSTLISRQGEDSREQSPQQKQTRSLRELRNHTIVAAFGDDSAKMIEAFRRWRAEATELEDPLTKRTVLIGMRMNYATLGAYPLARDCVEALSRNERAPRREEVPSPLACSLYNAQLALGETLAPRVPIAFAKAPRGRRSALMCLEVERLCHVGDLSAARTVLSRLNALLQATPLLETPLASLLARVSLAYAEIDRLCTRRANPAEVSELRQLNSQIGHRIGSARSHHRTVRAYVLLFSDRSAAARSAFDRAETTATEQRCLLALHWIERGRALLEQRRNASFDLVSKFARAAMHYAQQMSSPQLIARSGELFGEELRASRAYATHLPALQGEPEYPSPSDVALHELASAPENQASSLQERFECFQREFSLSHPQGEPLRAFLDALLRVTHAQRAAVFSIDESEPPQLLVARDAAGDDIEPTWTYDQELVQRCAKAEQGQQIEVQERSGREIRSAIAVPFSQRGAAKGMIYLDDPHHHFRFSAPDITFLTAVAPQLSLRLELEQLSSKSEERSIAVQDLQARSEHYAQALAVSEAKREQLLTNVHEPVILIDATQGSILELSASARALLQASNQQLAGLPFAELFPSERVSNHLDNFRRAVQQGQSSLENESIEGPNGDPLPVNIHLRRVSFGDLNVVQASLEDLRERNYLQEQIRRAQKVEAVGTLAGGIAHDFNNMLTAIGTIAESWSGADQDLQSRMESRRIILDTVDEASQLTAQLLDLTRENKPGPEAVNLYAHLDRVLSLLAPGLGAQISLVLKVPDDGTTIYIDQSELTQIVLNLTVNARDAMPNGGTLSISSEPLTPNSPDWEQMDGLDSRSYQLLRFSDTGTGIPQALLPQIFETFFTTKSTGTGLGLSTVHELVTRNSGAINVESQVYRGTTFKVALPECNAKARPISKATPATQGHGTVDSGHEVSPKNHRQGPPAFLIYVEDDETLRPLIARRLRAEGYSIQAFSTSIEALRWYDSHQPKLDLLLTDVYMPGINGRELSDALRTQDPTLRVVFLTGASSHNLLASEQELADSKTVVLQKPFSTKRLVETVRDALQG